MESAFVRRFTNETQLWDRFVGDSINGTFMHSRRFLSYHPVEKFCDHSLLFYDKSNRLVALLPGAEVDQDGKNILQSHPGATYGGLVVGKESSQVLNDGLVDQLVDYAERAGFAAIRMRVTEKIFHRCWCEELDAALFRAGFVIEGRELSCAVSLSGLTPERLLDRFRENGRRNVKKALNNGAVARLTDDLSSFWKILETNLEVSHHVRPTHSLDEILHLKEILGDQVALMGGYLNEKLVAGTMIFFMNRVAAHTMYLAQNYDYQRLRPLNLVIYEALCECLRRGVQYLNFGICTIPGTQGRKLNAGLYAFKQSCGGDGVVRDLLIKDLQRGNETDVR